MPTDIYRVKPKGTNWVGAEIVVSSSCNSEPKVERVRVTGVKQFGFIVSHEYDIGAYVDECHRERCRFSDCGDSVMYKFKVKCLVADVIGIGFGLGNVGTGTGGFTTPSREQFFDFKSSCVCCDDVSREGSAPFLVFIESRGGQPSATPLVLAFTALGVGLTAAILNFGSASILPRLFIYGTASCMSVAALLAVWRIYLRFRRERVEEPTHTQGDPVTQL